MAKAVGHPFAFDYPDMAQGASALRSLAGYVRDPESGDVAHAINDAWVVLGTAASFYPHKLTAGAATEKSMAGSLACEDQAKALEDAADQLGAQPLGAKPGTMTAAARGVPWGLIFQIALAMLQKLLDNQTG